MAGFLSFKVLTFKKAAATAHPPFVVASTSKEKKLVAPTLMQKCSDEAEESIFATTTHKDLVRV